MNDNPTSQCRAEESEVSISQKYLYSHVWNIIHNSLDLKTTLSVINRWKNRKKWYICTMGREGNGNLLQHSCLEYPRDGGAWWAAICGVAQSQTWLKWLSSSSSSMYNGRKAWQSIQCSYLENPMDRGTWWAKIHRVAKSQTQLKWLSMHKHHYHTCFGIIIESINFIGYLIYFLRSGLYPTLLKSTQTWFSSKVFSEFTKIKITPVSTHSLFPILTALLCLKLHSFSLWRVGERKDLLLVASKENTGIFPKVVSLELSLCTCFFFCGCS